MKTIHKRLYQTFPVIPRSVNAPSSSKAPRVRSNSASSPRSLYTGNGPSFFDSPQPPPPSSRPSGSNIVSPARLPLEAKTEIELQLNLQHNSGTNQHLTPYSQSQSSGPHPPFSLALTTPSSHPSSSYNPLSHYAPIFPYQSLKAGPSSGAYVAADSEHSTSVKRQSPRYHLDVGAYGIPKRSKTNMGRQGPPLSKSAPSSHDSGYLAVQIGEDAYFVRDNALGVADGVGGWSRAKHCDVAQATKGLPDTPSALFARRLMHYCAEEVESSTSDPQYLSPGHPPPSHRPSSSAPHPYSYDFPCSHLSETYETSAYTTDGDEYLDESEDPFEDFEDGLDVLMILERAYDKALKAHTIPPVPPPNEPKFDTDANGARESPSLDPSPLLPPDLSPTATEPMPLLLGSSTALVAVLDYASRKPTGSSKSTWVEPSISAPDLPMPEPVIKIAHLGDCMGMLVRGEEVVWRSEEMWSNFNTPLQLGPASSTRPADAQVFTIPVQTDDILILASDGLSDNLWDEEVLDEVIRFRRSFLHPGRQGLRSSLLGRRALAGMLSEALCSRARKVSERPPRKVDNAPGESKEMETPFARKAREQGRWFSGGKSDDISVLVALISPATLPVPSLL